LVLPFGRAVAKIVKLSLECNTQRGSLSPGHGLKRAAYNSIPITLLGTMLPPFLFFEVS
jgi:hypothetical protein